MLSYRDIAKIFEEIEIRLISSLKRNLGSHKNEEQQHGFKWSAWQAEKLRNIDKFRRENAHIMNSYTNVIDSATRQIMLDEFAQGVNGINTALPENIPDTPAEIVKEPHFFGIDKTKIDKLMEDVVNLEKHAETAVLRTMDDVYRQTVNKAQLAMITGTPLQKAIDMSVYDFLSKGINCIVYRNGRRVNIADYVRMALRTTATRASLQGMSAKIRQLGYDTVLISSYGMCSETCLPWQGRPYIDDVFSLWDGEIQERSDGGLWGKSHYCGKWFPLLSTAINGGLFHPNCRHTMTMWRDGDSIPEPMDNSGIQRRYKLEQHQRHLENKVRRAKRFAVGQSDPDNVKKAKKLLRDAQKELREFIADTNHNEGETVLKRDYSKEKIYISQNIENDLTSSMNSSIIEESRKNKYVQPINDISINKVKALKGGAYSEEQNKIIQAKHKELLEFARSNNPSGECAFILSSDFNSQVNCVGKSSSLDFSSREAINMLTYSRNLYVMHNHPKNSSFSTTDIIFLLQHDNVKTLSIVKHNGRIEQLTKSEKYSGVNALNDFWQMLNVVDRNQSIDNINKKYDKIVKEFVSREWFVYEKT